MSIIGQAEDSIVAQIQALLGGKVRIVDSVPANFSAEELDERLRLAPAVYVSFLGGPVQPIDNAVVVDAKFGVFALTANASGEKARRRGDPTAIGAYEIIEAVCPLLHGAAVTAGDPLQQIDGTGTLTLEDTANLWAEQLDKAGVSLYAATFKLPITLPPDLAAANLAPFATFSAQTDIDPHQDHTPPLPNDPATVDATDNVSLPQ